MTTALVGECLKSGWALYKQRAWFFIGGLLIVTLLQQIINRLLTAVFPGELLAGQGIPGISLPALVLSSLVTMLIYAGVYNFYIKAHDEVKSVRYAHLWNPKAFLNYIGVSVLTLIIVSIGFVLLIIPGIFALLVFFLAPFVVIDKGIGPIAALKESARLTKGNRFNILVLVLAIALLNIVGALLLLVGLLVTAPVSMLAFAHLYRALSSSGSYTHDPAPALATTQIPH